MYLKWCVDFPSWQGKIANYWKPCWEMGMGWDWMGEKGVDRKFWNWIRIHSSVPFSHLPFPLPFFSENSIRASMLSQDGSGNNPPPFLPFSIPLFMVIALQSFSYCAVQDGISSKHVEVKVHNSSSTHWGRFETILKCHTPAMTLQKVQKTRVTLFVWVKGKIVITTPFKGRGKVHISSISFLVENISTGIGIRWDFFLEFSLLKDWNCRKQAIEKQSTCSIFCKQHLKNLTIALS